MIGNHCLNCMKADVYDLSGELTVFCQKCVRWVYDIKMDCPDFEPKPALRALMEIFNEDTDKD